MTAERTLGAAQLSAFQQQLVRPIILMEGEFTTGTARFWTGYGTIPWNGQSWTGLGDLIEISPIEESVELGAKGFSVTLSGQNQANIALALSACKQGANGKFWLGTLDASGNVNSSPTLLRRGFLDTAGGREEGSNAVINVMYEDRLADLERARNFRYTPESQALFHPGDTGYRFVQSLQDATDVWKP